MKILSFGEILWDVYPDRKFIGGAPLNFAAHLARHGEEVYMLSALGRDALGEDALAQLDAWKIKTDYISRPADRPTGACNVTLDENSIPSYDLLQDVAYDRIDGAPVKEPFDVLYFGTLSLRSGYNLASLEKLLEGGRFGTVFADVNIRAPFYSEQTVRFAAQHAQIIKISDEELPVVAGLLGLPAEDHIAFAKALAGAFANLRCIVVTLGGEGAYAYERESGREATCPCAPVEVASTVGAGDSFSAAFLHKYLRKADLSACLEYAAKVAGFVVSQYAAVPDYDPGMLE